MFLTKNYMKPSTNQKWQKKCQVPREEILKSLCFLRWHGWWICATKQNLTHFGTWQNFAGSCDIINRTYLHHLQITEATLKVHNRYIYSNLISETQPVFNPKLEQISQKCVCWTPSYLLANRDIFFAINKWEEIYPSCTKRLRNQVKRDLKPRIDIANGLFF